MVDVSGMTIVPDSSTPTPTGACVHSVLEMQTWSFFANLAYGVTAGRDPQTGTNDMFAYQDLVETGELVGPRAFSTGPGVFSDTDFQSAEEVEAVVARYKKYYRTNTLKSYMIGNRRQRQWMIEACQKNEVMPTTEGGLDLKLNLTHALDGFSGNEHSLPVVPLFGDVVKLFASTGISYTPTLLVAYGGPWGETYFFTTTSIHDDPKIRRFIPHEILDDKVGRSAWFHKRRACLSLDRRIGGQDRPCRRARLHRQPRRDAGDRLSLGDVGTGQRRLAAARGAACGHDAWGRGDRLRAGPGQHRDRQAGRLRRLSADPLKDIHNTSSIRYVMKNGELFEGDTLDRIWPEKSRCRGCGGGKRNRRSDRSR